jgi:hypothetical protein
MKQVSDEYLAERSEIVPPPVPIATYLWDDGFLPHDTIWWSDFTRTGEDFMRLYAEIDWPEIAGVVAVQPTAVADLLTVTGNVVVDVDGEQREITPENVFLEMERQRAQDRGGADVDVNHKDVIASVGQEIMTRLKTADRQQLRQIANLLQAAADRRDIQGYAVNQDVQAILDERRWSGRITPDPATPTLAVTFSNMVATKSSLTMFPDVTVNVGPRDGQARIVTLDVTLRHEGTNEADPFYSGFQRWWIQVDLPEGSEFISSENPLQDDPDAPDGGAYLLELFPQQSGTVRLTFRMPDTERLLFRRQPGVNPVTLAVEGETCADIEPEDVLADITLNLADRCP